MQNLDDLELYKQLDPSGMLDRIHEMPQQCQVAWQSSMKIGLPPEYGQTKSVLILGMGGSAIGGDLLSNLVNDEARVPVNVCREYTLPAYVSADTLVIAASYSGQTEETLTAFDEAIGIGAKVMVVTTGGKLQDEAAKRGIPVLVFKYPSQPRAALAHSFIPLIGILQRLGYIADKSKDIEETVTVLNNLAARINERVPESQNPAKHLAKKLQGKLPVIYGAGILSAAARRWKGQVNENSKSWSFFELMPELNHNALVGYENPADMAAKAFVVMLRSNLLHPRVLLRYRITGEILDKRGVQHETIDAEGKSPLAHIMSIILFGDYVSYYLAMLNDVDPYPVEIINFLKDSLAKA